MFATIYEEPKPEWLARVHGFDIIADPLMPKDVIELRDKNGYCLCRMVNVATVAVGDKK